ncbi:MAG: hypothetical protein HQK54_05195 [Oligoflexales bacterium]|nr:hypothetical protein [Oligoflexales bacterium]
MLSFVILSGFLILYGSRLVASTSAHITVSDKMHNFSLDPYIEILEDNNSSLAIKDITRPDVSQNFKRPRENSILSWPLKRTTVWVRFEISNPGSENAELVLQNDDFYSNEISIFLKGRDGEFVEKKSGTSFRWSDWPIRYRVPAFNISLPQGKSEIFLRVSARSVYLILTLWTAREFSDEMSTVLLIYGSLLGGIFATFLYNILLYFTARNRIYFSYSVYVISVILLQMWLLGFFVYICPDSIPISGLINLAGDLFGSLACMGAIYFAIEYLDLRKRSPISAKTGYFLFYLTLANIALHIILQIKYDIFSHIFRATVLADTTCILIWGVRGIVSKYRPAYPFTLAWTTLLVSSFLLVLAIAGVIPQSLTVNTVQIIGAFIEVIISSIAVGYKLAYEKNEMARQTEEMNLALRNKDKKIALITRKKNEELVRINRQLEEMVEERTGKIRLLLDSVDSGIFLIDSSLAVQEGFSKSCLKIFGDRFRKGESILELFGIKDRSGSLLALSVEQVFSGSLPESVGIAQIPRKVKAGDKILTLQAKTILDAESRVSRILFIATDVTELELSESQRQNTETVFNIFKRKFQFKQFLDGFKSAIEECNSLISSKGSRYHVSKILHTLKGNCSIFGLTEVSERIHETENIETIRDEDIWKIQSSLRNFLTKNANILDISYDEDFHDSMEIDISMINELKQRLRQITSDKTVHNYVEKWTNRALYRPIVQLIDPLLHYAYELSARLKKKIQIELRGSDIMVEPASVSNILRQMVHLVNNAVIHGIEKQDERRYKPEIASIVISFELINRTLRISIRDDGRGIDVEKITQRAIERKIIDAGEVEKMTRDQKLMLIFNGLSTLDLASEYAGRGVGIRAVAEAVKKVNGLFNVKSSPSEGTEFIIIIPYAKAISSAREDELLHLMG